MEEIRFLLHDKLQINNMNYHTIGIIDFNQNDMFFWREYILEDENHNLKYLISEFTTEQIFSFYEIKKLDIIPNESIILDGIIYELIEEGNAIIVNKEGKVDVSIADEVIFYEYDSDLNNDTLLAVEVWNNETEYSIGRYLSKSEVKLIY